VIDYVALEKQLKTQYMGRTFLQFERLPECAKKMRSIASHSPEGMVVMCDEQEECQPSKNKWWHGPKGGLYLSVLHHYQHEKDMSGLLTLAYGAGFREALESHGVHCDLKWPNDVMVQGEKIGSIFVEGIRTQPGRSYLVSLYGNINNLDKDMEGLKDSPWVSIKKITGKPVKMERLMADCFNRIEPYLLEINNEDVLETIRWPWEAYLKATIEIALKKRRQTKWRIYEFESINRNGQLILRDIQKQCQRVLDPKQDEIRMMHHD
jgi:BirA family biotin operon repressor/biotin-[acetyl-CoA-carboxylase] ligase